MKNTIDDADYIINWFVFYCYISICYKYMSFPLYCKQAFFLSYYQRLIFLIIGNTMKNTMHRKSFRLLEKIAC